MHNISYDIFVLGHYIIYETGVTIFDRLKVYITFDGAANFGWYLKQENKKAQAYLQLVPYRLPIILRAVSRLKIMFGIKGGCTAAAGGGDCLPVVTVLHIAAGKYAGYIGGRYLGLIWRG